MDEISQQISEALIELEPQVTSPDPNERKLARRLRIERRLEALRRLYGSAFFLHAVFFKM